MRITCTKNNLHSSIAIASRVISTGSTLPILNNILLKTENGRLKLSSTNLEMAINTWVGGKIEEQGEITIPARIINDYVGNVIADKITLSTKNQTLLIEGESTQTHINGLGAEDFPLIPTIKEEVFTKVDAKTLQAAIGEVGFAASFSETQPEISGILLIFGENYLTLVGTDRYRLAEHKITLPEKVSGERRVIIPARAVNEVGRILGGGEVEIYIGENQVAFKTETVEIISRLIEGEYPDYQQIIPKSYSTEGVVNRKDLIQSLKAASLFATESNNIELELNPQTKQVTIKSQSPLTGDSEIRLEGVITGQQNNIVFNYRYLVECLNNLSDEKIKLRVISSSSPAAISPEGRENYLYIVMPIKI